MEPDLKFKKTTCSFYILFVTTILFTSIFEINSIHYVNASQIYRSRVTYEPVCKKIPRNREMPYGYEGYVWEPDMYEEYECAEDKDTGTISKDTQMCSFVGFECIKTYETKTFYRRKILPSPDAISSYDVKFSTPERYDKNVTDCECMMAVHY
ncbi:hypothetical protein O3M35_002174 [Rhynocoris fuscipes]|uniref:Uncharacterized protein n=1 Tax=Rhynocoris fuscipes TaxID=488301 RepID=A0AAW1CY92_9HEMI